jgi:serine/threonine protein kinase
METGIALGSTVAGRYRVDALLGAGGYGAVYCATQLNLNRKVALKVLHPHVTTRPLARERFEREARLAQLLQHPNVVRLYDFGVDESTGQSFIVWELLEGRSLEAELGRVGPLDWRRVARVASQVLKALIEAHGRGIVHRDIKPANLYLCDFAGEPDFVKVLDFGIATFSEGSGSSITQEGASLGTPTYMAPEQVLGEAVDARADLYALGLVMAEALSGAPLVSGRSAMEVALRQLAAEPHTLDARVLATPLGRVIARAVEKRRDGRFVSAEEMLRAVGDATTQWTEDSFGPTGIVVPLSGEEARGPSTVRMVPPGANATARSAFAGGSPGSGALGGPELGTIPSGTRVIVTPAASADGAGNSSGRRDELQRSAAPPAFAPTQAITTSAPAPRPTWKALLAAVSAAALIGAIVAVGWSSLGPTPKPTVSTTVVRSEEPDPPDVEDEIDKLTIELFTNIVHGSGDCFPLPPDLAAFAVQGLPLQGVLDRMAKAGFHCTRRNSSGLRGSGNFVLQKGQSTVTLFFATGVNAFDGAPNSRTVRDASNNCSITLSATSPAVLDEAVAALR